MKKLLQWLSGRPVQWSKVYLGSYSINLHWFGSFRNLKIIHHLKAFQGVMADKFADHCFSVQFSLSDPILLALCQTKAKLNDNSVKTANKPQSEILLIEFTRPTVNVLGSHS